MDRGLSTGSHLDTNGLRERNVSSQPGSTGPPDALAASGEVETKDKKPGKEMKTFGKTPDGTSKCDSVRIP